MNRKINFEINMTNRVFYSLIAIGFLLALGIVVWAGSNPGVSHDVEEIDGLEDFVNGKIAESAKGISECVTNSTSAFTGSTTLHCDEGYIRTGCSAKTGDNKNDDNYFGTEPISNEGCKFYNGWGSHKAAYGWIICCR